MVKDLKSKEDNSKIDRKVIANIGNSIYNSEDVSSVLIKIHFKDGSSVGYFRDEGEDAVGSILNQMNLEKEDEKEKF